MGFPVPACKPTAAMTPVTFWLHSSSTSASSAPNAATHTKHQWLKQRVSNSHWRCYRGLQVCLGCIAAAVFGYRVVNAMPTRRSSEPQMDGSACRIAAGASGIMPPGTREVDGESECEHTQASICRCLGRHVPGCRDWHDRVHNDGAMDRTAQGGGEGGLLEWKEPEVWQQRNEGPQPVEPLARSVAQGGELAPGIAGQLANSACLRRRKASEALHHKVTWRCH